MLRCDLRSRISARFRAATVFKGFIAVWCKGLGSLEIRISVAGYRATAVSLHGLSVGQKYGS